MGLDVVDVGLVGFYGRKADVVLALADSFLFEQPPLAEFVVFGEFFGVFQFLELRLQVVVIDFQQRGAFRDVLAFLKIQVRDLARHFAPDLHLLVGQNAARGLDHVVERRRRYHHHRDDGFAAAFLRRIRRRFGLLVTVEEFFQTRIKYQAQKHYDNQDGNQAFRGFVH